MTYLAAREVIEAGNKALDFIETERLVRRQILSALRCSPEVVVRQASMLYDREREAILDALGVAAEGVEIAPECTVPCSDDAVPMIKRFANNG